MEISEVIRLRKSVRTFRPGEVPRDLLNRLLCNFEANDRLNDIPVTMMPMPSEIVGDAMTGLIGSYGSIQGAPEWIIGKSRAGAHYQENFGFRMEQMILDCTGAGLGTCWVGGFFNLSRLTELVPLVGDEQIVCITPVGYAAGRRMAERTMRSLGGLNRRKPLDERVFHGRWGAPASGYLSSRKDVLEVLELARWAPSASNKQPCHYVVDDGRILITVLTSLHRDYPRVVTRGTGMSTNFQGIDAGIAMSHIHLAARALGLGGSWSLDFDEPAIRRERELPGDAKIVGVFTF
jgi:nitroreductase